MKTAKIALLLICLLYTNLGNKILESLGILVYILYNGLLSNGQTLEQRAALLCAFFLWILRKSLNCIFCLCDFLFTKFLTTVMTDEYFTRLFKDKIFLFSNRGWYMGICLNLGNFILVIKYDTYAKKKQLTKIFELYASYY